MKRVLNTFAICAGLSAAPMVSSAATVTAGPGGFNDGWATTITYEDDNSVARRGTSHDRDNPLNALGANDNKFFELGFGSSADFTFGTLFDTTATVFEITFGNVGSYFEKVGVYVGKAGAFQMAGTLTNLQAQAGGSVSLAAVSGGPFDTIRLVDMTPFSATATNPRGGFDVDAVRVTPSAVPLPAAGMMLLTAMAGGVVAARRRKTA